MGMTTWPPSAPPPRPWPPPVPPGPACFNELAALNQCYDNIQMMEQILSNVMVNLIETNPAIAQAMIAAMNAAGQPSVPVNGVTNGVAAAAGQVGQFVAFIQTVSIAAGNNTQSVSMGVLQPGDWDCWASAYFPDFLTGLNMSQPETPGFPVGGVGAAFYSSGEVGTVAASTVQGLISVPTLITMNVNTEATTAGSMNVSYFARRMR